MCTVISALILGLIFFAPSVFDWYFTDCRKIEDPELLNSIKAVSLRCFYPSSAFAVAAMYSLIRLLLNIRAGKTFSHQNVMYLFTISWCCFAVALICFIGGFGYTPFFFLTAAAGFMGMILRVVKNVMQYAYEIQQENDLTI